MSRWWRAYDEAVDDPKLILLTDKQFRWWFNLCCICSANGGRLPKKNVIAVKLRVSAYKATLIVAELAALGLVDVAGNGDATMHNWSRRQYQSDVSTERVKRFRNAKRNVSSTVSETPPETETETETETEKIPPSGEARKRATRLDQNWWPSIEDVTYARSKGLSEQRISVESEKFRNHWIAKSGKDAAKLDWHATWQNWILKAMEIGNGRIQPRRESLVELGQKLADEARELERAAGISRSDDPLRSH